MVICIFFFSFFFFFFFRPSPSSVWGASWSFLAAFLPPFCKKGEQGNQLLTPGSRAIELDLVE